MVIDAPITADNYLLYREIVPGLTGYDCAQIFTDVDFVLRKLFNPEEPDYSALRISGACCAALATILTSKDENLPLTRDKKQNPRVEIIFQGGNQFGENSLPSHFALRIMGMGQQPITQLTPSIAMPGWFGEDEPVVIKDGFTEDFMGVSLGKAGLQVDLSEQLLEPFNDPLLVTAPMFKVAGTWVLSANSLVEGVIEKYRPGWKGQTITAAHEKQLIGLSKDLKRGYEIPFSEMIENSIGKSREYVLSVLRVVNEMCKLPPEIAAQIT